MQKTVALWAFKFALGYVKKHPEVIREFATKVSHLIPGDVDDRALAALLKLL